MYENSYVLNTIKGLMSEKDEQVNAKSHTILYPLGKYRG